MTRELAEFSDGIRTFSYQKNAKVAPTAIAVGYVVVSVGKSVSKNIHSVDHMLFLPRINAIPMATKLGLMDVSIVTTACSVKPLTQSSDISRG
jgi:hypothetical protein